MKEHKLLAASEINKEIHKVSDDIRRIKILLSGCCTVWLDIAGLPRYSNKFVKYKIPKPGDAIKRLLLKEEKSLQQKLIKLKKKLNDL